MADETPGGVHANGDVAEVWQGSRRVGTLWDWSLEGRADRWEGAALKQSFSSAFKGGEVEVRFLITASSEHLFQLRGMGEISDCVLGEKIRHAASMKGTRLWTVAVHV